MIGVAPVEPDMRLVPMEFGRTHEVSAYVSRRVDGFRCGRRSKLGDVAARPGHPGVLCTGVIAFEGLVEVTLALAGLPQLG